MTISSRSLLEDARVVGVRLGVDVQQRRAWDVSAAVLGFEDTKGHCCFCFSGVAKLLEQSEKPVVLRSAVYCVLL